MKFCPECATPTGASDSQVPSIKNNPSETIQTPPSEESSNKAVWNVIVVCITVAILMWPQGVLGYTMMDRMEFDCSYTQGGGADERTLVDDDCLEWKNQGQTNFLTLVFCALLLLYGINKSDSKRKNAN